MTTTAAPGARAAESLLAAHGRLVGSLAFVVLQSQTDAEEIVVETLADCLRRGGSPPPDTDERLWVLRIAVRRLVAGRQLRATVEPMLPDDMGLPAAADRAGIERLALNIAMLELPIRDRTMIALEHVADLSLDEIALVMGIDRVVARSALDDARNRLFEAVEREPDFFDEL